MLTEKDYIDRDAVLDEIENLLYRRNLSAEQRMIVVQLGNYIAELPRKSIYKNSEEVEAHVDN